MKLIVNLLFCILLASCAAEAIPVSPTRTLPSPTIALPANILQNKLPVAVASPVRRATPILLPTPVATSTARPESTTIDNQAWKSLPVIPTVDSSVREIYEYGQSLGNDPRAFSIFGDCQSRPGAFFGVFETDSQVVENLSPELQETVDYFQASFNRESPTARDGTTPGSLLWTQWHQGKYGCSFSETPVECELRIHRPSFVIIQVGTHFESRNTEYLRRIILQLIDAGVVPILATKADNREKDERINRDMWMLAAEYDLPLWNFWAAVSELPDRGLYVMQGREGQGAIYLTDEAAVIHRMTGLEALNAVWRVAARK